MAQDETVLLNLKVTKSFKRKIYKRAKEGGYGTAANFIRSLIRNALDEVPQGHKPVSSVLPEALGAAYEKSQTGVVILDSNATYITVNSAYAKMHGYTMDEMIGQSAYLVYPAQLKDNLTAHGQILEKNGPHAFISPHVRKDGSIFTALVDTKLIVDEKGEMKYVLAFIQEIEMPAKKP